MTPAVPPRHHSLKPTDGSNRKSIPTGEIRGGVRFPNEKRTVDQAFAGGDQASRRRAAPAGATSIAGRRYGDCESLNGPIGSLR